VVVVVVQSRRTETGTELESSRRGVERRLWGGINDRGRIEKGRQVTAGSKFGGKSREAGFSRLKEEEERRRKMVVNCTREGSS